MRRAAITLLFLLSAALASAQPLVIHRDVWSYDRADLAWYEGKPPEKQEGAMGKLAGWVEFDVDIPAAGWYELYCSGGVWGWDKTYYVDGRQVFFGPAQVEDTDRKTDTYKVANLPLSAGPHALRVKRTGFPGTLPAWVELRAADGDPRNCIVAEQDGPEMVRAGAGVRLKVTGGCPGKATKYELVAENTATGEGTPAGDVSFPASDKFLTKAVVIPTPAEGCFRLRVQSCAGSPVLRRSPVA